MEVQDVDLSVTATLTCLMTDVSELLNVTWWSENGIITTTSNGYLANQGKFRIELRNLQLTCYVSAEYFDICDFLLKYF